MQAFRPAAFMILPTMACQASCSYCFARKTGSVMTRAVAEKALDFIARTAPEGKDFRITCHGGEPLLAGKDFYRWILPEGGRSYHVRLRMDVGAKNYLMEEYSCAEKLPKEEFYQEQKNNKRILDTHVNGLGAVRRFYLGLADKIEIMDTEDSDELKKEIAEYVRKQIGEDLFPS